MKRFFAAALCSVLLNACVSAPTTTPGQVMLMPDVMGLGSAPAPTITDTWWTAFGDPQLDKLVDEALKGSPTLAAALARARLAQSELAASQAATYPQLSLDAQEARERFSKDYVIPPPIGGSTQWIGTVQANLSWSLDFFGKEAAGVGRARATAKAASLDATAARLMLSGAVTQAYIALSRAYVLIDVAEEAVRQQQGILSLTVSRVKSGLDSAASQKQSEALTAEAREDLIRAQANRDLAVHQIVALIGRGADAYNISRPQLNEAALALPQALPADLLARRADVAAAQARIDAAFYGHEAARKAFYPDVNLIGLAGWAAIGLAPMFSGAALQYGAGPAIHLPIFDAGKLRADYAGATAGLDAAVADYNDALVNAVKQTADALTELRTLQDQSDEQRRALGSAEGSFALAEARYRSGISPQLNALDAESLLIGARRQSAALAADAASARVTLLMALGGGFAPGNSLNTVSANRDNDHD